MAATTELKILREWRGAFSVHLTDKELNDTLEEGVEIDGGVIYVSDGSFIATAEQVLVRVGDREVSLERCDVHEILEISGVRLF